MAASWIFASSAQTKLVRTLLVMEMRSQLLDPLMSAGFRPLRKAGLGGAKSGFPKEYFRRGPLHVDVLDFQWDKYNAPSFIINFAMVDDPEYQTSLPPDMRERWFLKTEYRISPSAAASEKWFVVSRIGSLLSSERAVRATVAKTKQRLEDVINFMNGQSSTPFIRDSNGNRAPQRILNAPYLGAK